MKRKLTLLIVLLTLLVLPAYAAENNQLLILEDVTIIDGRGNLPPP